MMFNLWIATFVDYGDTCDGKARVLSVYKTEAEAKEAVKQDMEDLATDHADHSPIVDFGNMSVHFSEYDDDIGCEWNIEPITFVKES